MAPVARPSAPPCAAGARIACWGLAAANADPWRCRSGVRQPYFSSSCPLQSAPSLTAQVILPAAPLQSLAAMCSLPLSQRLPRINLNLRAATVGGRRTTRAAPSPQGHKGRPEPSVDVPGTLNLNRDDAGPSRGPEPRLIFRIPARRTRQEKLSGVCQPRVGGLTARDSGLPAYRVRCDRWLPPGAG